MCAFYKHCDNCPINKVKDKAVVCRYWTLIKNPEKAEEIVMKWVTEHPIKTNGTKFKEVFGYRFADKIKTPEDIMTWLCEEYKRGQDNG